MAAGLASLRLLNQAAIERINTLGDTLARGFDEAFVEAGILGSTTSAGSLVQIHWRQGPIRNMADVNTGFHAAGDLPLLLHLELMNRGIYAAARGEYNISTVLPDQAVTHTIDTFSNVLHYLKPYIRESFPALLGK
jgi:glutamate-1-semialdehyde 2,1-aminomutase